VRWPLLKKRPKLSVIVIVYDMAREAPRTLFTLSKEYQKNVATDDYEVIVIDNGSPTPLGEHAVHAFGENFHYHYLEHASRSPAHAVNLGVEFARGDVIAIIVDGARMLSPGVLHYAKLSFRMYPDPVVATLAWHLGRESQVVSVAKGYNQQVEDDLLEEVDWREDGYRLFQIASLAGSSKNGFFLPIAESNCIFIKKGSFEKMGGFDERFDMPGGGLVNPDFYVRACERKSSPLVILLGEGTFHQVHGGIATNASDHALRKRSELWSAHYQKLRNKPFAPTNRQPFFLGEIPCEAMRFMDYSVQQAMGERRG